MAIKALKIKTSYPGVRYREHPKRHISEMENGKRPIGKARAKLLAAALNTDYRVFL